MIRFGGYFGSVLLLAAVALRLLEPAPGRGSRDDLIRDVATWAFVVGFVLIVGRLGDLAANSHRSRERILARVALVGALAFGASFAWLPLLLSSTGAV